MINRRTERFTLPNPIAATAGTLPVVVIDVSRSGFKLHHHEALPPRGESFTLHFRWNGSFVRAQCSAMWTTTHRLPRAIGERPTLATGLRIDSIDAASERVLESIIATVGNTAGNTTGTTISSTTAAAPPSAPSSPAFEPYLFCEFVDGKWQQRRTARRDQPGEGFTVAASEERTQVERLCAAYASGDGETRKLIRTLAALSLKSQSDNAPRTMSV